MTIFIRDQNDNQPLITLGDGQFTIEENREAGAEIQGPKVEISDIDRDEFSNGRWFLLVEEVGDNPCPGQFSIFPLICSKILSSEKLNFIMNFDKIC